MNIVSMYLQIVLVVVQILCYGCNSKYVAPKGDVEIVIDSVFLNYYEEKESFEPMYIFFHLSIKNFGKDTVKINLPWSEFDKSLNERSEFFGIYEDDTIKFYSGSLTPQSFLIYPEEIKTVDFQFGSCNELINLYEVKYKEQYDRRQDYMFDLASKSKLVFRIKGVKYKESTDKRLVIFRDPNDVEEHTWK